MTHSPLKRLLDVGQSPWLDFIQRGLLESGELQRMIEQWGVSGMTSNPVIFNKAIADTHDYDADIARLTAAGNSAGTASEARRLWSVLERPNVMIKVPATPEGLVAVRQLLAEGINVNVTLLFAVPRYREVLDTYLSGLEDALAANRRIERIGSVASFFLSRMIR